MRAEAQEEDQDGSLDQGQDGVVQDLGDVEPPQARRGVELRDVFRSPAEVR